MIMSVFLFINEQAKPSTAKWCVNPIRHYKLMEDFGGLIVLLATVEEQHCSPQIELSLIILM